MFQSLSFNRAIRVQYFFPATRSAGSIIRLTSPLTIPSGTTVNAPCQKQGAVFFLDGNGQPSLILENDVKLYGLIIYGFEGPQITAKNGTNSVKLSCLQVNSNLA
jgi:hypothetical protein